MVMLIVVELYAVMTGNLPPLADIRFTFDEAICLIGSLFFAVGQGQQFNSIQELFFIAKFRKSILEIYFVEWDAEVILVNWNCKNIRYLNLVPVQK